MKLLLTSFCALLLILTWHATQRTNPDTKIVIGILQTASHPSLDAIAEHFKRTLTQKLKSEVRFIEQNAGGQTSSLQPMMDALKRHHEMKLILTIATPATQTAVLSEHEKPILFTAVTDPSILAIAPDRTHVCGISDRINSDSVIEMIARFPLPTKTVAILYNPSEANSVCAVKELSDKLKVTELNVLLVGALLPSEMASAAQRAAREADLVLAPTDNLVAMTLPVIGKACKLASKPLVGMDSIALEHGAQAALGLDYAKMGSQAADMALELLQGTSPHAIGIQTLESTLKTSSQ